MFTGIVERAAPLVAREEIPGGLRLTLDLGACAEGLQHGDSVCVAGACLTVITRDGTLAGFDLSMETLDKTRLGEVQVGQALNVERSLRVGDRLGGHFVSGHVDGLGEVLAVEDQEDFSVHTYRAPAAIHAYLVPKGSVTIEGVSLTVAELLPDGVFTVALIPETLQRTTLGGEKPGDRVQMEGDLLGKYVQRAVEAHAGGSGPA
jgi:riboflavin synthase